MGAKGTSRVASGKPGPLSGCNCHLRIPLESLQWNRPYLDLKRETEDSSPVPTGITGFLSSINKRDRSLLI